MADEILSSGVFFRGTKVGSASLTIQDTSVPPTYNIVISNSSDILPNALDLTAGRAIAIEVAQSPLRTDVTKFYFKYSGADSSKIRLQTMTSKVGDHTGEMPLNSGKASLFFELMYYPSLVDLNATLELFHDQALTSKFATIPVKSLKVPNPTLTVRAARGTDPAGIYANDSIYIEYKDDNFKNSKVTTDVDFKAFFNNKEVVPGNYDNDGMNWFYGYWPSKLSYKAGFGGCWVNIPRQRNLSVSGDVSLTVTAATISASATIKDDFNAVLRLSTVTQPEDRTLRTVTNPLPMGTTDFNDPDLVFGYVFMQEQPVGPAFVNGPSPTVIPLSPASNFITNLILERETSTGNIKINAIGTEQRKRPQDDWTIGPSRGKVHLLTWNKRDIADVNKRRQFGKYQKTLSNEYKMGPGFTSTTSLTFVKGDVTGGSGYSGGNGYSNNIAIEKVQDSIATSLYGSLPTLNFTTLAVFPFTIRDSSIPNDIFALSTCVKFNGTTTAPWEIATTIVNRDTPLPPANASNPNDRKQWSNLLVLRNTGRAERNTFTDDTPYPRIVNVQSKMGYEAGEKWTDAAGTYWDFDVDPSLGIDLTDERYIFMVGLQNDSTVGFESFIKQEVELVGRSKSRINFRAGFESLIRTMSVAIIDTNGVSIPGSRSSTLVQAKATTTNTPGYSANRTPTAATGVVRDPLSYANGFNVRLDDVISISTGATFIDSPYDFVISLTFLKSNGLAEDTLFKPEKIYVWCEGETLPFELNRKALPESLTPANTASLQSYRLPTATTTATSAELARMALWLKSTLTVARGIRFSLTK